EQPQVGARLDAHPAARGHRRHGFVGARERDRLVAVTHEFGDAAESSETPLRFGISDLGGQKLHTFYRYSHSSPPDVSAMRPRTARRRLGSTLHHKPVIY